MKAPLYLAVCVALLCLLVSAALEVDINLSLNPHDQAKCNSLEDSNKKFAYNLHGQMAADHPDENFAFSPISINTALALLSFAAKGKTHDQIIEGIGLNISELSKKEIQGGFQYLAEILNDNKRELHLNSGNGIFLSQAWKILDEFLQLALKFKSEAFTINFEENEEAKKQINSYIEKKTNGKIVDMLSSVRKDAAFVFVNYIYFQAKWEKPFNPGFTKEGDFHVNKDLVVKVFFLSRTGFYKMADLDEATIVSVPYKGNATALFILPKEGKTKEVESHLKDTVQKFKDSARLQFVDLKIPKFTLSCALDLKEILPKFGIVDLFSNSADLSGITGSPNLKISQARHSSEIKIDEEGTEAAAATVMEGVPMSLPQQVTADRPFSFIIYDRNAKVLLFMGKVANPKA